jgi:hypothetical protein
LKLMDSNLPYSLFYQMTRITRDRGSLKHDDRLDVLAMAVSYWVESMGKDEIQSIEDWKQNQIDEELEKFMDGVFHTLGGGNRRPHRNWMDGPTKKWGIK